jgi:hypothetical protein
LCEWGDLKDETSVRDLLRTIVTGELFAKEQLLGEVFSENNYCVNYL